ncbi:hypothetical protein KUTeg_011076 [Tegillarca granosa]|uniref:Mab-21-like HhH/H2TH-like domain-containing protein n=1 Tax=Tegillarca granosa TaxID=220873 RepID=A0ABQ9F2U9_TEGGR|nr:hypothetical protein KUTeg_011076 [Tegillarca granosa]
MEPISVILWNNLSLLLGIEEQICIRRRISFLVESLLIKYQGFRVFSSGSRAEGLSVIGSDVDMMDTNGTKPGFAKLRFLGGKNSNILRHTKSKSQEDLFLPSLQFRDLIVNILSNGIPGAYAHGPCATYQAPLEVEADILVCLACKSWPRNALEWIHRDRPNGWPSPNLVQEIVQDGCFLVPIGSPNSQESHIEWRISCSIAEKKLVHSFNHTQFLCYGLLKLFQKHVINSNLHVKNLLCSYFLKTSLFYCIEEENIAWNKENFLHCFWTCIRRLLKWVRDEYCPNYFIKDNNMFEGKVCGINSKILFNHLFELYNDGLDSLQLIPYVHNFKLTTGITTNRFSISNEMREYLCDMELLIQTLDIGNYDCNGLNKLNDIIIQMLQETTDSIGRVIINLWYLNNTCYIVPFVYMDIQTTITQKQRYRQILGLKQFIKDNCLVGDISTGMFMLATLCYLNGEYKEVVIISQKIIKKFKSHTFYVGHVRPIVFDHPYISTMCGKHKTLNQKLAHGIFARHLFVL